MPVDAEALDHDHDHDHEHEHEHEAEHEHGREHVDGSEFRLTSTG